MANLEQITKAVVFMCESAKLYDTEKQMAIIKNTYRFIQRQIDSKISKGA